jgi:hypothetical protein
MDGQDSSCRNFVEGNLVVRFLPVPRSKDEPNDTTSHFRCGYDTRNSTLPRHDLMKSRFSSTDSRSALVRYAVRDAIPEGSLCGADLAHGHIRAM